MHDTYEVHETARGTGIARWIALLAVLALPG